MERQRRARSPSSRTIGKTSRCTARSTPQPRPTGYTRCSTSACRADESPKNALAAAFHADGRWTLERTPEGVAASCFNSRASARKFTFGWYRDGGCAPYFTGFAGADAGDEVKVKSPLRLGREGELNVLVRSGGAAARWEVRRAQSLLVAAGDGAANPTFQTFAKIEFGAATLDIVEGKATFAAGVPAKMLAVSECDLPVYGAPLRHVLWGDVLAKPSTADFAEIETIVGRLRIDAPEPPAPAASTAAAPAPPSGACLAPQGTAGKDPAQAEAAISAGDRSGALNASLWAVFDRPQGTREYTTRQIAFDFALRGSDLALPDASRSKLVFERGPHGAPPLDHPADPLPEYADLRLLFEDGKPLGFLPWGEYPRREASCFVWLGGLANGAIQARFDLTRATLAAARDIDLVNLRFRFVDFALTMEAGEPPVFARRAAPIAGSSRPRPGEFRDDRPTLVVEFDPQHVLEEALFAQNLLLPDVTVPGLTRSDILNKIASFGGDRIKILAYKKDVVLAQKKAQPGAGAFTKFAADYAADPEVLKLKHAEDQQVYIGPLRLSRSAWRSRGGSRGRRRARASAPPSQRCSLGSANISPTIPNAARRRLSRSTAPFPPPIKSPPPCATRPCSKARSRCMRCSATSTASA